MKDIEFKFIESNGIKIRLAMMGEGPLVIFCHGWPESWYSYRYQLPAVAEAGYKAVAYDVRGYGESDKPHDIEAYTMKNMTGDVIGIVDALGYKTAITIGHDWGGPIALNTAALNEDRITATGTMSVPFTGRSPMPPLDLWKEIFKDNFFYQLYFQEEGKAEKEFESDLSKALYATYTNSDGRGMKFNFEKGQSGLVPKKDKHSTFLEGQEVFDDFPKWFTQEDLDYFVSQFEISGLRGPFNRYRAQNIDWHELPELEGAVLQQPAFFITGTLDPVNFFIPSSQSLTERIEKNYKNLLFVEELEGIGHWTQQEAPEEVNSALLRFLEEVS
ncbi:alpha/beta hydrolase [Gammaproteobacteria bacterium]|nr:alpha/beta hydrolase [Gammaproteobacteria bacterium]